MPHHEEANHAVVHSSDVTIAVDLPPIGSNEVVSKLTAATVHYSESIQQASIFVTSASNR
jgi:hypothetical protein